MSAIFVLFNGILLIYITTGMPAVLRMLSLKPLIRALPAVKNKWETLTMAEISARLTY